jgi:hypothetical protein
MAYSADHFSHGSGAAIDTGKPVAANKDENFPF